MKEIWLANGKGIALVDDEDYLRCNEISWCLHSQGYAQGRFGIELTLLHIFILWFPTYNIDHRDGNKLNCQKSNLRAATQTLNNANACKRHKSSSIYKGVSWHATTSRWMARIQVKERQFYLGNFRTELEAAMAYNAEALKRFGEFAKLNIPTTTGRIIIA